jgi:hypothetical protein
MNAITQDRRQPGFDRKSETSGGPDQPAPRRPRRQFLNRRSAALAAVVTCAVGFYAGVRVEKGQLASAPRTLTLPTAGARAAGGGAAGARGAAGTSGSTAGTAGGTTGASRFGARAGGAGASFGTVSSVNGKTLVISEASGNTVKVHLASSTKISKSQSVSHSAIRPGDTVVIAGVAEKSGAISAATVTDSGAGSAGGLGAAFGGGAGGGSATSARSGRSGAAGGSGSAVGSLFSSGGGGGGG